MIYKFNYTYKNTKNELTNKQNNKKVWRLETIFGEDHRITAFYFYVFN